MKTNAAEALLAVAESKGVDVDMVYDGRLEVLGYATALVKRGVRPTKITDDDRRAALRLSRERREARRQRQIADNSEPGVILPWVVPGDLDLDPDLNPSHPVSVRKKAAATLATASTRQELKMKVSKQTAQKLLVALGYKAGLKYSCEQCEEKLNALDDTIDFEEGEAKLKGDAPLAKAYRNIMSALEKEQEIEVTVGEDKGGKKAPKKPEPEEDEDEEAEEEEEEADEDEEPEEEEEEEEADEDDAEAKPKKKPAKGGKGAKDKPKKKPPTRSGPTNTDVIIACLKKASAKKPATVETLHAACVEATGKCSLTTVKDALARDLKNRRKIEPEKNDKGWWLSK